MVLFVQYSVRRKKRALTLKECNMFLVNYASLSAGSYVTSPALVQDNTREKKTLNMEENVAPQ